MIVPAFRLKRCRLKPPERPPLETGVSLRPATPQPNCRAKLTASRQKLFCKARGLDLALELKHGHPRKDRDVESGYGSRILAPDLFDRVRRAL